MKVCLETLVSPSRAEAANRPTFCFMCRHRDAPFSCLAVHACRFALTMYAHLLKEAGTGRNDRKALYACVAGSDMEESGWKMVSGDVFRPPKSAISLCVQIGSGVQIITSAFATLFFAALGKSF